MNATGRREGAVVVVEGGSVKVFILLFYDQEKVTEFIDFKFYYFCLVVVFVMTIEFKSAFSFIYYCCCGVSLMFVNWV